MTERVPDAVGVLVVNDSPTVRASLRHALAGAEGVTLVGEASSGREAIELVHRLAPDLVLLDVVMAGMDGFATTRTIMSEAPTPIVLMSGVVDTRNVAIAMDALRAGALAIVEQLPPPGDPARARRVDDLARLCRAMSRVKVRSARPAPAPAPPRHSLPDDAPLEAIGIVASTGGPPVLAEILGGLPREGLPPVLLVQHIAAGFVDGFVRWLGDTTGHRVRVAADGDDAEPGGVWVAPSGQHLRLGADGRLALGDDPPVGSFRPSGTALLRSLARLGPAAVGIILTGMGDDGADGAVDLAATGGVVLAQDDESSAVWGMPAAAVRRGCVRRTLPPAALAAWLLDRVQLGRRGA